MNESERPTGELPTAGLDSRLTAREREVAVLVARGRSNREIAERLMIATSTAERHVANILAKLTRHSRTEIAGWVFDHKLLPADLPPLASISARSTHLAQQLSSRPPGTITFLFTDVQGSTAAWLRNPETMGPALVRHDELIERTVAEHDGSVVRPRGEGDSRFAVFARASDAVSAACSIQRALLKEAWPLADPLRVRIAIHTGEATARLGDYYGPAVNHCARLRAVAHGGQVLVSAVTSELVREALPTGLTLRDLGLHQLKDLQNPERIWQVVHPELPADFPPLTSTNARSTNLPQQLSSFVGRVEALVELRTLLTDVRLLTLVGPGGIGKTRLALRAASDVQSAFADGVWLVCLDAVADPALLPAAVSSVIGAGGGPAANAVDAVLDAVGSRQLLLLLDNCEHLVQACAEFVNVLLEHCPALRILATSREVLGVPGEVVWPVPPLSLPKPTRPQQFADSEAVRLFVERARAANPRFAVTDQNLTALVEVCRHLDGLPLAIELAAARARLLSMEQMASRLTDRLQLLTGGSRTALPRQQTLRNAIEWSYDLLTEREQALFCRLSVFAGGWTIEAAERVCRGSPIVEHQVLQLLGRLIDRSLVVAQQDGVIEPRYRLLETLREYAREKLAANRDDEPTSSRYLDYFIEIGEEARVHLNGGPKYAYWLQKLEAEKENLLASLRWALERHEQDRGLRLGGALWRFWFARRSLSEAREWLDAMMGLLPGYPHTATRARALNGAGVLLSQQDEHEGAESLYLESLAIYRELGVTDQTGALLNNLGKIALSRRDFATARALLEESLSIERAAGNKARSAIVLNNLALLHESLGEYATAGRLYADSSDCYREVQDSIGLSFALSREGHAALAAGEVETARLLCEEGLDLARGAGHQGAMAACCLELGLVCLHRVELAPARSFFQESLSFDRGPRHERGCCLAGLASLELAAGRPEPALKLMGAAEQLQTIRSTPGSRRPQPPVWHARVTQNQVPNRWTGPFDRQSIESCFAAARAALGEQAAEEAWRAGEALSLGEAVAYALRLSLEPTIVTEHPKASHWSATPAIA
jgi:predicted ATPase/class 3 adenylate cyclase/DNA-binding CsgD family transcriptional regulator